MRGSGAAHEYLRKKEAGSLHANKRSGIGAARMQPCRRCRASRTAPEGFGFTRRGGFQNR